MGWPDHLVGTVIRVATTWALVVFATALIVVSAVVASLVQDEGKVWEPKALREAREIVERTETLSFPS